MRKSKVGLIFKLLALVKPLTPVMMCTIIMGTIGFLTAIFISIFGGYAILNVIGVDTGFTNKSIFIIVIGLAVTLSITKYLEQLSGHYIAFRLLADIRCKVFGSLRKLAPAKLEGKDKGNMISIITSDIELIEVFYAHTIAPVSIGIICSLFMVFFIGSFHYSLGIIAFIGYFIVGLIIPYYNIKFGKKIGREYRNQFGELNSFLLESLRGLKEIIQYGKGDERREQIRDKSNELSVKNKILKNDEGNIAAITDTVILVFGLIILVTSLNLQKQGVLDFTAVIIATISMLGSFGPTIVLSALSNDLLQTLASAERVLGIIEEAPMVEDIVNKEEVDVENFNKVKVENVDFAYDDETILNNVSLEIPSNKIIGIHGVSGSGKSTLLKLLMRFWEVKGGQISFNDGSEKNINEINTSSLRKMESYVTQETYLFHESIKDNIKIAKLNATDEEVIIAAKKASIHDFIMSLPQGYDTKVAELGSSLSGGERQRIGIARAFLHNSKIIMLDEPTSNLDSLNEGIILKSLKEECKDKSVILVSHRKSTMSISDVVYKMNSGRVS